MQAQYAVIDAHARFATGRTGVFRPRYQDAARFNGPPMMFAREVAKKIDDVVYIVQNYGTPTEAVFAEVTAEGFRCRHEVYGWHLPG